MKYKIILLIFTITSCSNNLSIESKVAYSSKGFAYIYNKTTDEEKAIRSTLDDSKLQVSNNKLRNNALIKLINPKTKDSLILKNTRNSTYPDLYKVMITDAVAKKLKIDYDLPLIEIIEIRKNKSFVAKKAKIYNEEKNISSNAPVTSVRISNISKNKNSIKKSQKKNFNILIATFYSKETAKFLRDRIIKENPDYDNKKLKIIKKSNTESNLISGPYSTINLMKNDYILLKKFGFEELDFIINE